MAPIIVMLFSYLAARRPWNRRSLHAREANSQRDGQQAPQLVLDVHVN
jgi:hypothetical protein